MRFLSALCVFAAVACDDPAAPPAPPSASSVTSAVGSVAAPSASLAPLPSAAPHPGLAPLSSAAQRAQHDGLRALVPRSMPPACKLKPVRSDAPAWLQKNPEISSERKFIDGFAPVALPSGTDAAHVQSALYLVYDENGTQAGLFGFVFASGSMASFVRTRFDQSRPQDPDRFVLDQRNDVLLVQWTDGKKGACWEALAKHRAETAKK